LSRQCLEHFRTERLFEVRLGAGLVGSRSDPRLGGVAVSTLLESVQEFTEPPAQEAASADPAEAAAELTE
jgi:hypothetical protein